MSLVKITRGNRNYTWQILPGLRLLLSDIPEVDSHKTEASAGGGVRKRKKEKKKKRSNVIKWMLTLFVSEIWRCVSLSLGRRRSELNPGRVARVCRERVYTCRGPRWRREWTADVQLICQAGTLIVPTDVCPRPGPRHAFWQRFSVTPRACCTV